MEKSTNGTLKVFLTMNYNYHSVFYIDNENINEDSKLMYSSLS